MTEEKPKKKPTELSDFEGLAEIVPSLLFIGKRRLWSGVPCST